MKFFNGQIKFLAFLFSFGLFLYFFAFPFIIEGNSMLNTFHNHDRIIVSRILSKIQIKRGDIVICKFNNKPIIKRVIALPGEHVFINNNFVYVNDKLIKEPYILDYGLAEEKIIDFVLSDNEYFIMGDNRNSSIDSRIFGPVNKKNIVAKVLFKFFPRFSFVNYNWEEQ